MNNYVILLAAGSGTRMESHSLSKCFIKVKGKELFKYSLDKFLSVSDIKRVYLVVPEQYQDLLMHEYADNCRISVLHGGKTRQESVFFALNYMANSVNNDDLVLIHDAARPLISERIILDNISTAKKYGASLTAIKSIDTIIHTIDFETVDNIPERNACFSEQTPAAFRFDIIKNAHENALEYNIIDSSDDCALVMKTNQKIHLVRGERNNFKITNEIDLALFKAILDNDDNIN